MANQSSMNTLRFLSGSWLKLIAVVAMLLDHAALILGPEIGLLHTPLIVFGGTQFTAFFLFRKVGRLAFPLFCFLLAEGYRHSRNRVKYGIGLLLFALLSEIPFNLMLGGTVLYPAKQNVFVTLSFGLLLLWIYDRDWKEIWKALGFLAVALVTVLVKADYGLQGALLVLLLHALRQKPALRMILSYPLLSGGVAAFAAFLPISLYNGQRGFIRSKGLKYGFYLFYPVHILILWMIKTYVL